MGLPQCCSNNAVPFISRAFCSNRNAYLTSVWIVQFVSTLRCAGADHSYHGRRRRHQRVFVLPKDFKRALLLAVLIGSAVLPRTVGAQSDGVSSDNGAAAIVDDGGVSTDQSDSNIAPQPASPGSPTWIVNTQYLDTLAGTVK